MQNDDLNVHVFPSRNRRSPISDSEDLSIGMILREKNGAAGLISEEKALYAELNKRAEAATSSYSATAEFLQYIYPMLAAKNHQT